MRDHPDEKAIKLNQFMSCKDNYFFKSYEARLTISPCNVSLHIFESLVIIVFLFNVIISKSKKYVSKLQRLRLVNTNLLWHILLNINEFSVVELREDELIIIEGGFWAEVVGTVFGALYGAVKGAPAGMKFGPIGKWEYYQRLNDGSRMS